MTKGMTSVLDPFESTGAPARRSPSSRASSHSRSRSRDQPEEEYACAVDTCRTPTRPARWITAGLIALRDVIDRQVDARLPVLLVGGCPPMKTQVVALDRGHARLGSGPRRAPSGELLGLIGSGRLRWRHGRRAQSGGHDLAVESAGVEEEQVEREVHQARRQRHQRAGHGITPIVGAQLDAGRLPGDRPEPKVTLALEPRGRKVGAEPSRDGAHAAILESELRGP